MYTYLEDINQIKKRHGFPHNLICKIRDIEHIDGKSLDYYKFTIYNNNNNSKEYTCICNPRIFQNHNLTQGSSIVIEYAPIQKFEDIGECFLIRKINKPSFGLTGDADKDIQILQNIIKELQKNEH